MAGISVVSSTNACINVDAENVGTRNGGAGIFRFANFNPTTGLACTQGGTGGTGHHDDWHDRHDHHDDHHDRSLSAVVRP